VSRAGQYANANSASGEEENGGVHPYVAAEKKKMVDLRRFLVSDESASA
jgi:hypothetical protein